MQYNASNRDKVEHIVCTQFFSWTPIIIGALVALGLGFLLDLFAKGIGLSLYTTNPDGATALAVGGFLALVFGGFVTMFAAGFASGFFAGPTCGKRNYGAVYGLVAWCLGLFLAGLIGSNLAWSGYTRTAASSPTATEVSRTTQTVTSRLHPATDAADTQGERNIRATGMASLALFVIFFVGAIAASFGGYFGFNYWERLDRT